MNLLITGGTGSFGNAFVDKALKSNLYQRVVVLSRDEMKQWHMAKKFSDERLRFFIGDVRDQQRLHRAFYGIDHVIHAAATKIVPTAEYNPFEAVKTNIDGAKNVIDAAIDQDVKKVVALSTDKASSPINLYGATKLVSDKLFVAANHYSKPEGPKFSVVRYGNVMGSRGSVIPFFKSIQEGQSLPITDARMTRFMITLDQGVDLVSTAFDTMVGGEVYVKKIPSMNIMDIAKAVRPELETQEIGIRPGEKLHEQMIGSEDAPYTFDFNDHYRIYPLATYGEERFEIAASKKIAEDFVYASDTNEQWMTVQQLRSWLSKNGEFLEGG